MHVCGCRAPAGPAGRVSGQPKADEPNDRPKADEPNDRPKADEPNDRPKADEPSDRPKADEPNGRPKADEPNDRPKAGNVKKGVTTLDNVTTAEHAAHDDHGHEAHELSFLQAYVFSQDTRSSASSTP